MADSSAMGFLSSCLHLNAIISPFVGSSESKKYAQVARAKTEAIKVIHSTVQSGFLPDTAGGSAGREFISANSIIMNATLGRTVS